MLTATTFYFPFPMDTHSPNRNMQPWGNGSDQWDLPCVLPMNDDNDDDDNALRRLVVFYSFTVAGIAGSISVVRVWIAGIHIPFACCILSFKLTAFDVPGYFSVASIDGHLPNAQSSSCDRLDATRSSRCFKVIWQPRQMSVDKWLDKVEPLTRNCK